MTPPFLTSPLLNAVPGVRYGFFTRRGGVSRGLYDSLNVGRGSRDRPEDVAENRRRVAEALGAGMLNTAYQIHSSVVATIDRDLGGDAPEADGVVTGAPGVLCGALSADCAPILIVDPEAKLVGAVHAGWKGALSGVVEAGVKAMIDLGGRAERMVAAVGPCIGPRSYEVGEEFEARFVAIARSHGAFFRPGGTADKRLFDLPGFVVQRLTEAGIGQSEWIGADTAADEDFFSNRRAFRRGESDYGRLASAIVLTS
jgi:YfiH family protein